MTTDPLIVEVYMGDRSANLLFSQSAALRAGWRWAEWLASAILLEAWHDRPRPVVRVPLG